MNKNKLKAKIVEHGETQNELAEALGLSISNLSLRINGHIDFRQSEINAIKQRYNLSPEDVDGIFFAEIVS